MNQIVKDRHGDFWLGYYNQEHQGKPTPNTIIDDDGVTWDKLYKVPMETRALSIRQPWAWAIVNGFKPVENRSWSYQPDYRGALLIHAGKKFDDSGLRFIRQRYPSVYDEMVDSTKTGPFKQRFRTGGIVGMANMTGVVTEHDSEWFVGPMGFVLENPVPLKHIPYKGQLNFFSVPARTILELEVKNN